MALIHHDARDYDAAASEAVRFARAKFEKQIEKGAGTTAQAVEKLFTEVPIDALAPVPKLEFEAKKERNTVELNVPGIGPLALTDWSFGQMAEQLKTPARFARELAAREDWGAEALADLWNEIGSHTQKKVLLRRVGEQVRGVLSDKFGRKDGRPIVESFLQVMKELGAVAVGGTFTETRFNIQFMSTTIHQPVGDEVIAFGAQISGSDYGRGAIDISGLVDRLWCTNLATMRSELRSVHIGPRITEAILLSEETERHDLAALRSAVKDVARYTFGPAQAEYLAAVKKAAEEKLSANEVRNLLTKTLDTKAEVEAAELLFASAEIEQLPPGQNTWRLSNVLSLLARDTVDSEQRIDYERAAGKLLKVA